MNAIASRERRSLSRYEKRYGSDSALGRALINILLVFAQMEREATSESHAEGHPAYPREGYHFGKVPYGKKVIPAPDNPRMKILVEDDEEQAVMPSTRPGRSEGAESP